MFAGRSLNGFPQPGGVGGRAGQRFGKDELFNRHPGEGRQRLDLTVLLGFDFYGQPAHGGKKPLLFGVVNFVKIDNFPHSRIGQSR